MEFFKEHFKFHKESIESLMEFVKFFKEFIWNGEKKPFPARLNLNLPKQFTFTHAFRLNT